MWVIQIRHIKNYLLGDAVILPMTIAEIQTWIVG
jgi:hypothetical protein